jgi:hypothetical protein
MEAVQRDLRGLRVEPGIPFVVAAQIGEITHLIVCRETSALQTPGGNPLFECGIIEPLVQAKHIQERRFLRARWIEAIHDLARDGFHHR